MLLLKRKTKREIDAAPAPAPQYPQRRGRNHHGYQQHGADPGGGVCLVNSGLCNMGAWAANLEAKHVYVMGVRDRKLPPPLLPMPPTPPYLLTQQQWAERYAYYMHTAYTVLHQWLVEHLGSDTLVDADGLWQDLERHMYRTSITRFRRYRPVK